jgi:hypothetical protein
MKTLQEAETDRRLQAWGFWKRLGKKEIFNGVTA